MKKIFVLLSLLLTITLTVDASKAMGIGRAMVQPDGSVLMVRLLGDEHFSWYQTVDGVLLKRVDKAFYIGRVDEAGQLESTGVLAHNADIRQAEETAAVEAQDKNLFFSSSQQVVSARRKAIADYPSSNYCPHMGEVRIPVILMNYTDTTFVYPQKDIWEEYFNGTEVHPYSEETKHQGYGSVGRYFSDASNGKFTPKFDIYGPYTASMKHNQYGSNKALPLLKEAVALADKDINFKNYDSDGNGYVDMVYVVYAGTGANTSEDDDDVWPLCYTSLSISTNDGKTVRVIGCANELSTSKGKNPALGNLVAGIGVTCHEMSHGLGLPDLYWTLSDVPIDAYGYTDYNNCGPEDLDLMDGGENLCMTYWPPQYAAWERDILGWTDLDALTEPATVTVRPLNKKGGKAFKVVNPSMKYEYYVIENMQYDEWNAYMCDRYTNGMLLYHLNASSSGFSLTPNNKYGHPDLTIVPADGMILASYSQGKTMRYRGQTVTMPQKDDKDENGESLFDRYFVPETQGDPYPGLQNVTEVARYKNYYGSDMVQKYPITGIRMNSDNTITFDFMGGGVPYGINEVQTSQTDAMIYTLNGVCVGTDTSVLPRGIYVQNGRKFIK